MSADRLHRPPAGLAGKHLPRSAGATAAAPLADPPVYQPAAAPSATLGADPASMPDSSATSPPALSDRPKFPEFTGHNSRNPHARRAARPRGEDGLKDWNEHYG